LPKQPPFKKYCPWALTVDFLMLKRVEQRKCHHAKIGTFRLCFDNLKQSHQKKPQILTSKLDILAQ
jgi:hypothetical protein